MLWLLATLFLGTVTCFLALRSYDMSGVIGSAHTLEMEYAFIERQAPYHLVDPRKVDASMDSLRFEWMAAEMNARLRLAIVLWVVVTGVIYGCASRNPLARR